MITEIATKTKSLHQAFQELQEREQSGSWLSRLRGNAITRFEEAGFPTTKDEEWKYTNVAAIAKLDFSPTFETQATEAGEPERWNNFATPETKNSQLVFVNGNLRADLSS